MRLLSVFPLSKSLWMAEWPYDVSATSSSFMSSANYWSPLHSILLIKILNRSGPAINCWSHYSDFGQKSAHHICHFFNPNVHTDNSLWGKGGTKRSEKHIFQVVVFITVLLFLEDERFKVKWFRVSGMLFWPWFVVKGGYQSRCIFTRNG